jgi:hypothetical protein
MTKKKQKTVNWEKLCGQLQEALAKEMKENEELRDKLHFLVAESFVQKKKADFFCNTYTEIIVETIKEQGLSI